MKNILIIGCGLLGSSLLRSISKKKIAKKIFIYEKSKANILKIKKLKLPCTIIKNFKTIIPILDLIIFCTPMSEYEKIILKINSISISPRTISPETRDNIIPPRPNPIKINISLYSVSTDLTLEPISPFFIFVICLSSSVVSKKVTINMTMLKLVAETCSPKIEMPFEYVMKPTIISRDKDNPTKTCFDDFNKALDMK